MPWNKNIYLFNDRRTALADVPMLHNVEIYYFQATFYLEKGDVFCRVAGESTGPSQ